MHDRGPIKQAIEPNQLHDHAHADEHHSHHHAPTDQRALWLSFCVITGFMVVELVGGKLFGSLALLADAGHMFNDSLSLALAVFAVWYGHQHNNSRGKKVESGLALLNGMSLLAIAVWIVVEAIGRFNHPQPMMAQGVLAIAVLGLIVNVIVMKIMHTGLQGDERDSLNMKAAYAHVLADVLGSVGAIVASLCLWAFGWQWADPLASLLVAIVVLKSGISVSKQAVNVLNH